jgi:hypothetical protein
MLAVYIARVYAIELVGESSPGNLIFVCLLL